MLFKRYVWCLTITKIIIFIMVLEMLSRPLPHRVIFVNKLLLLWSFFPFLFYFLNQKVNVHSLYFLYFDFSPYSFFFLAHFIFFLFSIQSFNHNLSYVMFFNSVFILLIFIFVSHSFVKVSLVFNFIFQSKFMVFYFSRFTSYYFNFFSFVKTIFF